MEYINLNKLSHLHNGIDIFFCKTDFLLSDFNQIKKLNNEVILISGNSDYPIDQFRFNGVPSNVKKWYAENALLNNEILIPIPLGIECLLDCDRFGHGIGYFDRVTEKERLLNRGLNITPSKDIYSNFVIFTNIKHRSEVKDVCIKSEHIDWEEPNLTLTNFFDKILEYKMVVCPSGNGIDTHRLWEVLYSGRVPITIKMGDYKIYELYKNYPIIILDNINELNNFELINEKYEELKKINFNHNLLDCNYWINKIKYNL